MANRSTLGVHMSKCPTPELQRKTAREAGYSCFQTHYGNPQSLVLADQINGIPVDQFKIDFDWERDPIWVIHAAYLANCTPRDSRVGHLTAKYLKNLLLQAQKLGASYVVVHTGGTKDKAPELVGSQIRQFLISYGVVDYLEGLSKTGHQVCLAVENVAAAYPFNAALFHLMESVKGLSNVGWTLDLAHAWAAGIPFQEIKLLVEGQVNLPLVCHANFPGSKFSSGKDRHGWRYKGYQGQEGSDLDETDIALWDVVIGCLYKNRVPLILEGSRQEGTKEEEFGFVSSLLSSQGKTNEFAVAAESVISGSTG